MTPAELITRKLKAQIESAGSTLPVHSLLLEALDGEKQETPSSGIALNVHISEQLEEPLPHYAFSARAILTVSLDDDKGGNLFLENYNALWAAFDNLARGDNCEALGDEADELAEGVAHVFAVDGFQIVEGETPDFQTDENGGYWTTSFAATITGRAN
ncbi:MAG: hypothetical protein IKP97_00555 [Kiritimatiellae bacterium]|nr:hypothetical protein [Kiritimatiellia bacterium]